MRLNEFLQLADNLGQLKDLFPRDVIWGELELAVRGHWKNASNEHPHLVIAPSTREEWKDWCRDSQRHLLSGENVKGTVYYPKPIVLDDSSTVDGAVYCDAEIRTSPRTVISGDLVSRESILWCGQLARSLVSARDPPRSENPSPRHYRQHCLPKAQNHTPRPSIRQYRRQPVCWPSHHQRWKQQVE